MLPYSYRNISVYIKKLVDSGGVSLSGMGNPKSYTLLNGGRKTLFAHSPRRCTPELYELNKALNKNPDRSGRRDDVVIILSMAGLLLIQATNLLTPKTP